MSRAPCAARTVTESIEGSGCLDNVGEHALQEPGFLGTAAPLYADVVLLLEIGMAIALLLGAFLARVRKYRRHALCQSAVVLLNLAVILVVMAPALQARVLPAFPTRLHRSYYLLSSLHAGLGFVAEGMALYILLAAGTKALPSTFRLANYKAWMRSTLVLWWSVLLLGVATYVRWYVH